MKECDVTQLFCYLSPCHRLVTSIVVAKQIAICIRTCMNAQRRNTVSLDCCVWYLTNLQTMGTVRNVHTEGLGFHIMFLRFFDSSIIQKADNGSINLRLLFDSRQGRSIFLTHPAFRSVDTMCSLPRQSRSESECVEIYFYNLNTSSCHEKFFTFHHFVCTFCNRNFVF